MVLTADGASYLQTPDADTLLTLLRKSVAGFDELLDLLGTRALTLEEGRTLLNNALAVEWESDAQVKFRLGWLENLGVVAQHSGRWELNRDSAGG